MQSLTTKIPDWHVWLYKTFHTTIESITDVVILKVAGLEKGTFSVASGDETIYSTWTFQLTKVEIHIVKFEIDSMLHPTLYRKKKTKYFFEKSSLCMLCGTELDSKCCGI